MNDTGEPRSGDLANSEGWAGLRALDDRLTANAGKIVPDEGRRIAEVMLKVFSSDEGSQVLEWMLDQTVRRASVPHIANEHLLVDPAQLASFVLWSEAQKAFVLRVVQLMEVAKSPPG